MHISFHFLAERPKYNPSQIPSLYQFISPRTLLVLSLSIPHEPLAHGDDPNKIKTDKERGTEHYYSIVRVTKVYFGH